VVLHLLKKERENIRYQVELTNQVFTQIETICERQVCHGILDRKERIPYLTLRNLLIPSLALQNFFLPYLTLSWNFIPYITLPLVLLVIALKMHWPTYQFSGQWTKLPLPIHFDPLNHHAPPFRIVIASNPLRQTLNLEPATRNGGQSRRQPERCDGRACRRSSGGSGRDPHRASWGGYNSNRARCGSRYPHPASCGSGRNSNPTWVAMVNWCKLVFK
jgi:hypothetical protein